MILQVCIQEVGVHSMGYIGADKEAVGVHLGDGVGSATLLGERFTYSLQRTGKEVRVCALAEQRANFFVVKASDYFDIVEIGV